MKLSIAICIYNDFDFIEQCVARAYDLADEIVILDGPYDYCKPLLQFFDLYYSGMPEELRKISELPKVRYEFAEFENEKSKRVALYEMCRGDVVMLLDTDELLIDIDRSELERFVHGDKSVACSTFYNLTRRDCLIGDPTKKFIFFKRRDIAALEHLNYTWLVGVDQEKPDQSLLHDAPLTEIAHLTLMRSPYFNTVKYCFYTRLYYYSRGMLDQLDKLFGLPFDSLLKKNLPLEEIKDMFRRSIPALLNFPVESALVKRALPTIGPRFDRIAPVNFLTDSRVRVLAAIYSYHYLDIPKHLVCGDEVHFTFRTHAIEGLVAQIFMHRYSVCTRIELELEVLATGDVHGAFELADDAANLFGTLIGFKAKCGKWGVGTIAKFELNPATRQGIA